MPCNVGKEEEERQAAAAREKLDNTGEHRERERAVRSFRLYDGVVLLLLLSVSKSSLLCVCVCVSIYRPVAIDIASPYTILCFTMSIYYTTSLLVYSGA